MKGRRCAVASCGQPVGGHSKHCEAHKRTLRRHGHAEQKGVTVYELSAFKEGVERRRAKNPGNPTWSLLEGRWLALTGHAEATMNSYSTGAASITHERATAALLLRLRDTVPASAVINTALAMVSMEEQRPSRFRSDRAFLFELARRVRGLADVAAGSRWSPVESRMKRTYSEVPPRVLECLGASLQAAFGVAGMRLAALDKQDADGVQAERVELHDALRKMT